MKKEIAGNVTVLTYANTTARRLATTGRVDDGLGRGPGVSIQDVVDDSYGRSVSLTDGRLTGPEDVNTGA